jgi:hypothetical protein
VLAESVLLVLLGGVLGMGLAACWHADRRRGQRRRDQPARRSVGGAGRWDWR